MRITRRNCMLLVYVKMKSMKMPIVVPLPLALLEEVLRAMVAITWLFAGGMQGARRQRLSSAHWQVFKSGRCNQRYLGYIQHSLAEPLQKCWKLTASIEPWRILAGARHFVSEIRSMGAFNLVDVDTADFRVRIRLL